MTEKKLYAGSLYWPTTLGTVPSYEPLGSRSEHYDVVIVGGGISGLLCAHALVHSGIRTAVVERGEIAGGSTAASTGLIQFANDIMLSELADRIGIHYAVHFYTACKQAVEQLSVIAERLPDKGGFKRRYSLYMASTEQDLPMLKREFEMLVQYGFGAEWWSPEQIRAHFPFSKPGAIVTHGDAEINPYQFVHGIAADAVREGLTIYEHTPIDNQIKEGGVHRLSTPQGGTLTAGRIVYAIGYEPEELRGELIKADLSQSFVTVTEPQNASFDAWHQRWMIWETARPYMYLRTAPDNRVIIGGLDEQLADPIVEDVPRQHRTNKLHERLKNLFPTMDAPIAYEWSATFGESSDGLPFIGRDPSCGSIYYCLVYGGNGTVYSTIASKLLRDLICGEEPSPIADIVGLERLRAHAHSKLHPARAHQ